MMSNEGMKPIGLRIKVRREELGLTQEELSKRLGYKSKSSLNKIELGIQGLRQSKIKAIADALQTTPSYIMGWGDATLQASQQAQSANPSDRPASDPLQSYLAKLSEFLTAFPEHRQLVSDAAHVRAEDIGLACQFLERLADPDSAAPDLPVLDTCNRQKDTNSDTLDTSADTLDTSNRSQDTFQDTFDTSGDTSRGSGRVELTADTLALVRDTPEVLEAEAEYIKKMSVKPPKRGGTASPSTEGTSRKSG